MAECRLAVSRPGQPGTDLVMGLGKDHNWRLDRPVPWLPASRGTWARRSNATKFRQFNFISLQDQAGKSIARMGDYPYTFSQRFKADLLDHLWVFEAPSGESFDVVVRMFPTPKKFRIRETFGGSVSYVVFQGEGIFFEIQDLQTGATFKYIYKGTGITTPFPKIPKVPVPNIPGSGSGEGPWNDFIAPGWMSAADFEGDATMQSGNVALGTSYSSNYFSFAEHVDNRVGYLVELNLNTGRTIGLPSIAASSGTMQLWYNPSAPAHVPVRPR
jgi:hypothetical protein